MKIAFGIFIAALTALFAATYSRAQFPGISAPMLLAGGAAAPACTPNTQGGGTDANTIALWHFDNNVNDGNQNNHPVTLNGSATFSATRSKFGGYSLSVPASGTDFASFGGDVALTGDFTVEGWLYLTTAIVTYFGWVGDNYSTNVLTYDYPTFAMQIQGGSSAITASSTVIALNNWHHLVWMRAGGKFSVYYDGVAQAGSPATGSATGTAGGGAGSWRIGHADPSNYKMPANSYVDEVRFSNMARYSTNFTPAILPFCDISPPPPPTCTTGAWHNLVGPVALANYGAGFGGNSIRVYFPTSTYIGGGQPAAQIRASIKSPGGQTTTLSGVYAGHGTGADSYTFDGTQVQLKLSGSNSWTIAPSAVAASDATVYSFNNTKPFIVSFDWTTGTAVNANNATGDATATTYQTGPNLAGSTTITPSGGPTSAQNWGVALVEICY